MQNTLKEAQATNGFRIDTTVKIKTELERIHEYAEKNNMEQLPYHMVKACYLADRDAGRA